MLSRYYDTVNNSVFDIFDPFKVFNEIERNSLKYRSDTIDDEGIKIEMPGIKHSDIDIFVEGRTLKVSGKSRHGKEFSYVYSLKSHVDEANVEAHLKDGLLAISLPKKVESSVRKVVITT